VTARQALWLVALALGLRLGLASLLPVTGDEAYFVTWGRHPALGYYDHPPMIGWWLALLSLWTDHPLWIRMPALVVSLLPGLLLYLLFRHDDPERARLMGLLGLFLPVFTIAVISSTDTPLILFSLLSAYVLHRALAAKSRGGYLLAGALLGLALLSKYLAGLLAIAYALYFLLWDRGRWRVLFYLVAGSLPFFLVNLYWNWNHCGYNMVFNFVSRGQAAGFDALNPVTYLLMLAYFYTPWLLWFVWRRRHEVRKRLKAQPYRLWAAVGLPPLGLLLLLAPFKTVGLHWVAPFGTLPLVLAMALASDELRRSLRWMVYLALLQTAVLGGLSLAPIEWLSGHPRYAAAVINVKAGEVAPALFALDPEGHYMTGSYSRSALLAYHGRRHVGVFGHGSRYGRQDDMLTDFRVLKGETLYILLRRESQDPAEYTPFFTEVQVHRLEVRGAGFTVVEGRGFDYEAYREAVIVAVLERHYDPPGWLPIRSCDFVERYASD
jgi:4-amino-4-deoxy-L-arabinose transferase-like glycosyltransferase